MLDLRVYCPGGIPFGLKRDGSESSSLLLLKTEVTTIGTNNAFRLFCRPVNLERIVNEEFGRPGRGRTVLSGS